MLLNAALQQSDWTGEVLTERTWRDAVGSRLQDLAWDQVLADVRPFLEMNEDAEILTIKNSMRLLDG